MHAIDWLRLLPYAYLAYSALVVLAHASLACRLLFSTHFVAHYARWRLVYHVMPALTVVLTGAQLALAPVAWSDTLFYVALGHLAHFVLAGLWLVPAADRARATGTLAVVSGLHEDEPRQQLNQLAREFADQQAVLPATMMARGDELMGACFIARGRYQQSVEAFRAFLVHARGDNQ